MRLGGPKSPQSRRRFQVPIRARARRSPAGRGAIKARPASRALSTVTASILLDDLLERHRPALGDHLPRQLLGARARAFQRHQQPRLHLRLGAGDLGFR